MGVKYALSLRHTDASMLMILTVGCYHMHFQYHAGFHPPYLPHANTKYYSV